MLVVRLQIFSAKNPKRKSTMQVFINNNAQILLSKQRKSVILKQSWKNANMNKKKIKMENLIDDESDSESDKDNDECNE